MTHIIQYLLVVLFGVLLILNIIALRIMTPELKTYQDQKPLLDIDIDKIYAIKEEQNKRKALREAKKREERKRRRARLRGFKQEQKAKDYVDQVDPNNSKFNLSFVPFGSIFDSNKKESEMPPNDTWVCSVCGKTNPIDIAFCKYCEIPAPDSIKCPACSLYNWKTRKICSICSTSLSQIYAIADHDSAKTIDINDLNQWICQKCNTYNSKSTAVCDACHTSAPNTS